jgi:predicted nucleotidyltransferase
VARDEATDRSDVDILAEFEPGKGKSLLNWGAVQWRLAELLGTDVDLSCADWLKEPIRTRALAESVRVF